MKRIYLLIIGLLIFNVSSAETYRCSEHAWFLEQKDVGFEHVNHIVSLNGKVVIKELEEAMWFIEKVKCTSAGFVIDASHIQYGDTTIETFTLIVKDVNKYEFK